MVSRLKMHLVSVKILMIQRIYLFFNESASWQEPSRQPPQLSETYIQVLLLWIDKDTRTIKLVRLGSHSELFK